MVPGFLRSRLHEPETGAQGGAGSSPNPTPPPQGGAPLPGFQHLVEKQGGDAGRVAELLYRENYDLREKNRQLGAQVPAQGAVILQGDQAQQWQAYQQLGKAEELKTALDARTAAEAKLASLERGAVLRQVQDVSGYKASVLAQLPGAAELAFALREVEVDGKKTSAVFVKDAAEVETPLAQYAQTHWADFLPALTQAQASGSQGTAFVRQAAQGGQPASPVDAFIQQSNAQRETRPNPLARK